MRELAAYGALFVHAHRLIAAVRGIVGEAHPNRLMRLTVPEQNHRKLGCRITISSGRSRISKALILLALSTTTGGTYSAITAIGAAPQCGYEGFRVGEDGGPVHH